MRNGAPSPLHFTSTVRSGSEASRFITSASWSWTDRTSEPVGTRTILCRASGVFPLVTVRLRPTASDAPVVSLAVLLALVPSDWP